MGGVGADEGAGEAEGEEGAVAALGARGEAGDAVAPGGAEEREEGGGGARGALDEGDVLEARLDAEERAEDGARARGVGDEYERSGRHAAAPRAVHRGEGVGGLEEEDARGVLMVPRRDATRRDARAPNDADAS